MVTIWMSRKERAQVFASSFGEASCSGGSVVPVNQDGKARLASFLTLVVEQKDPFSLLVVEQRDPYRLFSAMS